MAPCDDPRCGRLKNSEFLSTINDQLLYLSVPQKQDIIDLLRTYTSVLGDVPTRTSVLRHNIDVGDGSPIKQHVYRCSPAKREAMRAEVEYLAENGFAKLSCSPWSSPYVMVPKSDDTPRFCSDFRKVNGVTKTDSFPLPRMDDLIDRVGPATCITKLDLLKGYWKVPLTPPASDISAFVTPDAFMQYTVMPFGLKNAPATLQQVLGDVPNCSVYLDDVVVFSNDWKSHLSVLREVFQRLADASLTLNLAKCEFGKATVTCLGKQVGHGQVRPVEAKVRAVLSFPVPTTRRELRRFLGMVLLSLFLQKLVSTVVSPLTRLCSPAVPFVWSEECHQALLPLSPSSVVLKCLWHRTSLAPSALRWTAVPLGLVRCCYRPMVMSITRCATSQQSSSVIS